MLKHFLTGAAALAMCACTQEAPDEPSEPADTQVAEMTDPEEEEAAPSAQDRLQAALDAQDEETKARYEWRRPEETLRFFEIEPGMTVVEVLPGGGWYSKILLDYLGPDGRLVLADYSMDMWRATGGYADEEFLAERETWTEDSVVAAQDWRGEDGAEVAAFVFESLPDEMKGTADAVLAIRALHGLSRMEDEGGRLSAAITDMMDVLKPGGIVGVVQHRAPAENSDEWANGENGYLKQDAVIAAFENAGFEFVASSEINANPDDRPTEEDGVWRLPPTLGTSGDDEELRAEMEAIGESDRMTLKFRKPE